MIPKDIQLMIDKICRSCMGASADMHNVFQKQIGLGDEAVLLCDVLMACAAVEVCSGDGLPYLLCNFCESKLSSAYEFKQQCEKSERALRDITNSNQPKDNQTEDEDDLPLASRKCRLSSNTTTNQLCCYCFKGFTSKKHLKGHLREHIGDDTRYCPICPSKYHRTNHLMRHMKSHDMGKKHLCKICDEEFSLSSNLYRHMQGHIEEVAKENQADTNVLIKVKKEKLEDETNQETYYGTTAMSPMDISHQKVEDFAQDTNDTKLEERDACIEDSKYLKDVDDDSMDVPLSQFPFSDEDDDDDDDLFKEDSKDEDFDIKENKEKRQRGRPPTKNKDHTLYECKECSKILTTYSGLKVHLRRHTGSDLSKCKHCDKSFTKKSHLNRHLRSHGIIAKKTKVVKGDKKTRECEFCDRKFKYKKSFVHHMQVEHGMSDVDTDTEEKTEQQDGTANNDNNDAIENFQPNGDLDNNLIDKMEHQDDSEPGEGDDDDDDDDNDHLNSKPNKSKIHTCHVCQSQFARANHLTRHMTLHRACLTHKCDKCDQAFFTQDFLKQHVEQQHINKPYVCTTCNKPFSRGEHLIRHLKLHQEVTEQGQHKCSICETVFSRSDHLARHTKSHLMQDKRHVCIECGKAFNRLDNLKTHQRIHTGLKDNSKLHLCVYCGKEFNNSSNMIVHMRRHTGERPYKCNECGKGFPRSHDLKCHERTHSGEKPYLCTLCGKSFNKSNKLLRHSRVHTGERPYVCNICTRAFTQSNDLALHMRRHTGARPYACGVCPARFIQSGQLKNHRRQSGHWMDTQPDLKGGHRVEPVSFSVEPMPIKFKTFGKNRLVKLEEQQQQQQQPETMEHLAQPPPPPPPQRILMGIMGNIKLQNEQPLIIDSNKLVELPGGQLGLVTLPTVIHGAVDDDDDDEIKLKTELGSFNLAQVEDDDDDLDKNEAVSTSITSTFHESDGVSFSTTVQTSTTYTSAENFSFQNYN